MNQGRSRLQLAYRGMKGPAWRSELARQLVSSQQSASRICHDTLTRDAIAYLRRRSGSDGQCRAGEQFPDLAAAYGQWDNDAVAEDFRILVLANSPREEIAARLQIDVEVVVVMEGLFFDIRWALDASDWIICRVIIPEMHKEAWDMAAKMRLAYFGGPVMARAILDARVRLPFEEAGRLFDREILLHVKLQEALEAPLTNRERMDFLKFYMDYEIKRQRLELDKKKFTHKCERDKRRGVPGSRSEATAASDPENDGAGSKSDDALQTEDCHSVVMKDLWKRLVA